MVVSIAFETRTDLCTDLRHGHSWTLSDYAINFKQFEGKKNSLKSLIKIETNLLMHKLYFPLNHFKFQETMNPKVSCDFLKVFTS
jgi:hypothetical protein